MKKTFFYVAALVALLYLAACQGLSDFAAGAASAVDPQLLGDAVAASLLPAIEDLGGVSPAQLAALGETISQGVAAALPTPTNPGGFDFTRLGELGVTGLLTYLSVNAKRDNSRAKRGEQVDAVPRSAPQPLPAS